MIGDSPDGKTLAHCFRGCMDRDVYTELRRLRLIEARGTDYQPRTFTATGKDNHTKDAMRTERALARWREAQPIKGTIAEIYLRSRRILLDAWPKTLRYHPRCPRPKAAEGAWPHPLPAMIALVEHVDRGGTAIHCTYLRPDGSAKADLPKDQQKAMFGPAKGGAVRFGNPRENEWLAIGEGIETTLSVVVACGLSAWAALSTSGMKNLILPPDAHMVLIAADNDPLGGGQRASRDAGQRFIAEGRRVRIATPPQTDTDFNNMLQDDGTPNTAGASDAAA